MLSKRRCKILEKKMEAFKWNLFIQQSFDWIHSILFSSCYSGLMKAFPFVFLVAMYIIISWKQVIFSPFFNLFVSSRKSHSRESFFSKEEIIFRSSHIFEFYFFLIFFFWHLQRICINILLVGIWMVDQWNNYCYGAGSEDLLDNRSLSNFLTSFFKTSTLLFIKHWSNSKLA